MATRSIRHVGIGRRYEATADEAFNPGHLLEVTATGVQKHSTGGGYAVPMFAMERELFGEGLTEDDGSDWEYASDDLAIAEIFRSGDEVYARFADENHDIAVGDLVQSDGTGAMTEWTAGTEGDTFPGRPVGIALEAVGDLTGGEELRKILIL